MKLKGLSGSLNLFREADIFITPESLQNFITIATYSKLRKTLERIGLTLAGNLSLVLRQEEVLELTIQCIAPVTLDLAELEEWLQVQYPKWQWSMKSVDTSFKGGVVVRRFTLVLIGNMQTSKNS